MIKDYEYFSSSEDRKMHANRLVEQTNTERHFILWFLASFAMLITTAILSNLGITLETYLQVALYTLTVFTLTVTGLCIFTHKNIQMFTIINGMRDIFVDGRLYGNQKRFLRTLTKIIKKTDPSGTIAPQLVLCLYAPYRFTYDTDTKLIKFSQEGYGDIYVNAAELDLDATPCVLPVKGTVQYESY